MFEDPLGDHVHLVETVAAAGVPAPEAWRALHGRLQDFLRLADQTPARDDVTAAVINGDPDVPTLRCLALAEVASHMQTETVHNHVRNTVYQRMLEAYNGAAAYTQVAEKFNTAVKRFVTAASTVDPEADAVAMIEQPDKARKAWLDSESHANALTRLLPATAAAAALAGIDNADSDAVLMVLCADLSDCHRRRAWESWVREGGRTRRWGALLKVGAVLRAAALDEYAGPYREPKPLERRQEQIGNGGVRTISVDPEDADYRPPPIDPRRPGGRMVVA